MPGGSPGLFVHRAPRFVMTMPLRCRRRDEDTWLHTHTINVSRTGVLFTTPREALDHGQPLEFLFTFPTGSEVICEGRVVRLSTEGGVSATAVEIERYRMRQAGATHQSTAGDTYAGFTHGSHLDCRK